jgi:Tol biopolymer transport system component
MGRTGEAVRRVTSAGFNPSWSPDGAQLAFTTENVELYPQNSVGRSELWTVAVILGARTYQRLTDFGEWPVWLPDSRRVLFVAGGSGFFTVDTLSRQVRKIFSVADDVIGPPRLTPDGRTAYFSRRVTESDIWLCTLR